MYKRTKVYCVFNFMHDFFHVLLYNFYAKDKSLRDKMSLATTCTEPYSVLCAVEFFSFIHCKLPAMCIGRA